ncbi:glucosaminidase domain-containing protein [Paraglaciecola aquimarina]|uniref:Glucosaminidase domain-containing protein n=1 Tax=Paraglaciecola algarum TaxID=3050085 RepID=A0ABS9D7G7_9ALTE|nr:glucosaminidase domain-containing protein [Paraglaciecola sp. G1-23]MCF2948903.1 glucosaminidase domain-containing protein [Paraglaciecola sp. G1-23]
MHKILKNSIFVTLGFIAVIILIVVTQHRPVDDGEFEIVDMGQINLDNLYVAPLPSSKLPVPDFAAYSNVVEKKKAFFAYLLPEIRRQNFIVLKERKMVLALYEMDSNKQTMNRSQLAVLKHLMKKYQVSQKENHSNEYILSKLIKRIDVIPEAMILVQAANESGWGTSRFARDGYNFFGLWCFRKGCGFVPSQRNEDSSHEVAKFRDLSHAVMTYVRNLNRLYAYHDLREIRIKLRRKGKKITSEALVKGLSKYSERGQDYIDELQNMIRVNRKHMGLTK